jgi:hypothetical protein
LIGRKKLASVIKEGLPRYSERVDDMAKIGAELSDGLEGFVKEGTESCDVALERFRMLHGVEDLLGEWRRGIRSMERWTMHTMIKGVVASFWDKLVSADRSSISP